MRRCPCLAGNILVRLDRPRGTRALYDRIAERIGLKVYPFKLAA